MKLKEIADRIDTHLKRFEEDPVLNRMKDGRTRFYNAGAYEYGRFVSVRYISYQMSTSLSKQDALEYLAWLDAGNVGTHYVMGHKKQ